MSQPKKSCGCGKPKPDQMNQLTQALQTLRMPPSQPSRQRRQTSPVQNITTSLSQLRISTPKRDLTPEKRDESPLEKRQRLVSEFRPSRQIATPPRPASLPAMSPRGVKRAASPRSRAISPVYKKQKYEEELILTTPTGEKRVIKAKEMIRVPEEERVQRYSAPSPMRKVVSPGRVQRYSAPSPMRPARERPVSPPRSAPVERRGRKPNLKLPMEAMKPMSIYSSVKTPMNVDIKSARSPMTINGTSVRTPMSIDRLSARERLEQALKSEFGTPSKRTSFTSTATTPRSMTPTASSASSSTGVTRGRPRKMVAPPGYHMYGAGAGASAAARTPSSTSSRSRSVSPSSSGSSRSRSASSSSSGSSRSRSASSLMSSRSRSASSMSSRSRSASSTSSGSSRSGSPSSGRNSSSRSASVSSGSMSGLSAGTRSRSSGVMTPESLGMSYSRSPRNFSIQNFKNARR